MKYIAILFSYLFHPLLVVNYASAMIIFESERFADPSMSKARIIILGLIFLYSFVIPFLYTAFLRWKGVISSLTNMRRSQRQRPLFFSGFMMSATAIFLFNEGVPGLLPVFIGAVAISIFTALLINRYKLISLHAIGLGGWLALAVFQLIIGDGSLPVLAAITLIAGITGSSRIYLQAHQPEQVYLGYFCGFAIVLLSLSINHFLIAQI